MPDLLCCDVTLREMPNGDWVVFMLGGGWKEPLPENRIMLLRSIDRGTTWSDPVSLFDETGIPTEVTVIGEKITLYFVTHRGDFGNWFSWFTVSSDNGQSWTERGPAPVFPERSAFRGVHRHSSGALLLPYQYYPLPFAEEERLAQEDIGLTKSKYVGYQNGVLKSRDNGDTWEPTEPVSIDTGRWNWSELGLAELSNGTVTMLVRVDGTGRLYRSDSSDVGESWCEPYPTDIPNPGSKIRLFTLPDGRVALIHNPNPKPGFINRHPLSLWISTDDMKSWSTKCDLHTFPGAHSYPDGFLDWDAQRLHISSDYNRHDAIYAGIGV